VRRIVFLSLVFHPDTSATSMLFTDLFRRLAARGLLVTVLCGFPTKDEGVAHLRRRERLDGIEIVRCGLRLEGKRNLAARALAYGSFLAHAGVILLRMGPGATVLAGTDPPFTAAALGVLSCLRRIEYQCLLLDVYPEGLVGIGRLGDRAAVTRVWRALNRLAYRRARNLLVIGRDMVDLLREQYGIDGGRVTYVPLWATTEVEESGPLRREGLLERVGLARQFVVQYSGNMGLWHDMESIVRAAARLQDEPEIHFLFLGKGMRRGGAERLAQRLGVRNITWLDFVPRGELPQTLSGCDVALVSLRAGLEGVAVPSKLYGIMATGRPVVAQAPERSELARVVSETGCGIVVRPGDAGALAEAIRGLSADRAAAAERGRRAREAYLETYALARAVERYERLWGDRAR
jgi:glycosyltransferase involved in cell wall biosynthesis